jgi:hypothetical protein
MNLFQEIFRCRFLHLAVRSKNHIGYKLINLNLLIIPTVDNYGLRQYLSLRHSPHPKKIVDYDNGKVI